MAKMMLLVSGDRAKVKHSTDFKNVMMKTPCSHWATASRRDIANVKSVESKLKSMQNNRFSRLQCTVPRMCIW